MKCTRWKFRNRTLLLCVLGCLLCCASVIASDDSSPEGQSAEANESTAAERSSTHREEIEVVAREPDLEIHKIDLQVLDSGRAPNLAAALESIVGLSGIRRSQNSFEPVVHGLGWERVQTQVDHFRDRVIAIRQVRVGVDRKSAGLVDDVHGVGQVGPAPFDVRGFAVPQILLKGHLIR